MTRARAIASADPEPAAPRAARTHARTDPRVWYWHCFTTRAGRLASDPGDVGRRDTGRFVRRSRTAPIDRHPADGWADPPGLVGPCPAHGAAAGLRGWCAARAPLGAGA